jgi:hypothetical protein
LKAAYFKILSISLALLYCGCSTSEKKAERASATLTNIKDKKISSGELHEAVFIKNDSSQSYALYLPSYYSSDKEYPVIYFFDPHAKGKLPVSRYKSLAEKHGYILIGCNNTENGMERDKINQVVQNMFEDSRSRFAIHSEHIYTAGFSGGARIAGNIAVETGTINGVIACGAGLGTDQQPKRKFSFFGIAGIEDFNYTELKNLDNQLEKAGWAHFFMEFPGKHEWPPLEIMEDAFTWLDLRAMSEGSSAKNDSTINSFIQKNQKMIKNSKTAQGMYADYLVSKKIEAFTRGLSADDLFRKKLKKYEEREEVQHTLKHISDLEEKEDRMKKFYTENFQTRDIDWWEHEVKKLDGEIKTLNDKEEIFLRKRVLNFLSLVAYMNSANAVKNMDLNTAAHFIEIYKLVDPKNPYHAYLHATVFMKMKQPEKAMTFLSEAAQLGFDDYDKLKSEKEFDELNQRRDFIELLQKVKENAALQKF